MTNVTVQEALKAAIEAMEYHTEQTRPIQKTIDTLAQCKAALSEIEKCEPVYQVFSYHSGGWIEVNKHQYDDVDEIGKRTLYTSPQPIERCEPVAYALMSIRGKPHKLSMTKSSCLKKQEAWQKEWPNNGSYIAELYDKPQPREWVGLSDNFIAETIWENTKLNPNIKDDAETLLYVTNAVKAILAESKQLNMKG